MKNGFALKVRHFRLLWVGWQKLAARQLREARGLEKSFYAWIKPATRADARYSLEQARQVMGERSG